MMNPPGTKFFGDKIVPQSDLRAKTASDRIIKEKCVNKNKSVIKKKAVKELQHGT